VGRRLIVVLVLRDARGDYLICRMPEDRGAYPGQWGLPGGGVEDGERLLPALRREAHEELGLEIEDERPVAFSGVVQAKLYPGGHRELQQMIFLIYSCRAAGNSPSPLVRLNAEFDAYAWVDPVRMSAFDLNQATIRTFRTLGILAGA
jgi:nucleoside triphosphatase